MSLPRSVLGLMLLLTFVAMLVCGACGTARPTLSGRLVNSMKRDPAEPVPGVLITVQEAEAVVPSGDVRIGEPEPGDIIKARPEILGSTISGSDGSFSLAGTGGGLIESWSHLYQLRFHRDDYKDAIYNVFYPHGNTFIFIDQKQLGPVPLRPKWADPPSTQPTPPVDVISR